MTTQHFLPDSEFGRSLVKAEGVPASARLVLKLMEKMSEGSLTVTLPDGRAVRFGTGEPHADIALANWNVCDAALKNGDIGFGETYIAGDWSTSNLSALMHVMVANRNAIEAVIYGKWWGKVYYRARHLLRRNSRIGSRKNVNAHYDIGNAFYRLWLDPTMTYSSALYGEPPGSADDLEGLGRAQEAKYRRILQKLSLAPGQRLLEIGCGWGGLAELAVRDGLHITGLTLSTEQLEYASGRLSDAGLLEAADLRLQDYRDVRGQYDAIASIEMFEAVGEQYWQSYFECLRRSLKPGGRAVVQTITIADPLFSTYRKSSDFIQQYIFPGGMLPTRSIFREQARRAGLVVSDEFAFGQDYARTLHVWLRAFYSHEREVRAQGFDTPFVRTWAFYLAYCEAAFRHANTDVVQFTLEHES
ncbi:MAG: cyclopropane-fatty-acyl-phospholipid synthase family protein [Burkholderiaceae bacterium]|jgi:cyclopropane-fatty-acyl-phospholipid synthase